MARKVTDKCINCGSCESVCPVNAISEKDGKRFVDASLCVDRGGRRVVCPIDAIEEA